MLPLRVEPIAPNVYLLKLLPRYLINVYWVDGILIDAAVRISGAAICRLLQQANLRPFLHVLSHAHPDHQGASHLLCKTFQMPLWCSEQDAPAVYQRNLAALLPAIPWHFLPVLGTGVDRLLSDAPHPVTRYLREGDRIGSFEVIASPGHTNGHLSFWRQSDGVLLVGDVVSNTSLHQRGGRLHLPPPILSVDPLQNQHSLQKLVALNPRIICFGHGPPLYDSEPLQHFVRQITHP